MLGLLESLELGLGLAQLFLERGDLGFGLIKLFLGRRLTGSQSALTLQGCFSGRESSFRGHDRRRELFSTGIGLENDAVDRPLGRFGSVMSDLDRRFEPFLIIEHRENIAHQDVVPFIDVIRHGTRVQKQLAIGLMSRHYRREFATALKEGLADSDNSVRIQAATAIANIENRFYEQLQALRERVEEEPEAQTILALARQYDDYAFTGLLDGDREARNRDEALAGYRRYLQMQPNDVRAHMAVVRLLVKMDRAEEALLTIDGIPPQIASADELAAWRMEALYKVRRFEETRDIARALIAAERPERPLPAVFADSVRLWAGVGPKPVEPRHAQPGLALQAGGSSP